MRKMITIIHEIVQGSQASFSVLISGGGKKDLVTLP